MPESTIPTPRDPVGPTYMVLDVESVGLHGEGFAAAWVVVDRSGQALASASCHCPPDHARGLPEDRGWVAQHVTVPAVGAKDRPRQVRREFWDAWVYARSRGATLWADCCWPVEARFLVACVDDAPEDRRWEGPYPLHDIATLRLAAGFDPIETMERREGEMPAHNPLADARQSARLLLEALEILGPRGRT